MKVIVVVCQYCNDTWTLYIDSNKDSQRSAEVGSCCVAQAGFDPCASASKYQELQMHATMPG